MFASHMQYPYFAAEVDADGEVTGERYFVFETEEQRDSFVNFEDDGPHDDDMPKRVAIDIDDVYEAIDVCLDFGRIEWAPAPNDGYAFTIDAM